MSPAIFFCKNLISLILRKLVFRRSLPAHYITGEKCYRPTHGHTPLKLYIDCLMTKNILIWNCSMKIKVFPASWSWHHLLSQRTQYFLYGTQVKIIRLYSAVSNLWKISQHRGLGTNKDEIIRLGTNNFEMTLYQQGWNNKSLISWVQVLEWVVLSYLLLSASSYFTLK